MDYFPIQYCRQSNKRFPEKNIKRDGCMKKNSYRAKSKTDFKKSSIQYEKRMSYYTRTMFAALKSSAFTNFLEELTGVQGILPDPHFEGSGVHVTSAGGHLNIHADFNWYNKLRLDRRVNVLLFLNPDWDESYGGHLELWSKDMKSCMQRVLPTLGRLVVFSSTDFSYHGHPQNLTAPPGRARRSLALYFYSNGRPQEECIDHVCSESSHGTLFQEPVGCNVCEETTCNVYQEYLDVPITNVAHQFQ